MRDFIIATDADSELLLDYVIEKEIPVFPMPVTLDGVEYDYDLGQTVSIPDFFARLEGGASFSTSCKSPWEIKKWFEGLLKKNRDILYIGFSPHLSQHYGNCEMAVAEIKEENKDANIILVNSLSISAGQSILIRRAVEMREAGKSIEETAKWVEDNCLHSVVFFSVDDLNYLKRGGRLSGGAAFFGTVLDLKPILHTSDEGKLEPIEKVKGRKKAWKRIAELAKERAFDPENGEMLLIYSAKESAEQMKEILMEVCGSKNILMWPVGPVIGGHAGPNVMGLAFMGQKR
jgi:DegV family protein with EDD domain